jgi:hypothetical protein
MWWRDRQLWLAVLIAAVIVVPRSALVSRAQSEGFDDEYHLSRGMAFWYRTLEGARLNDPPLGEAISAIPLCVLRCEIPNDGHVLYHQRISLENLLTIVAVWKSLLFLPMVGVVFWWLRQLYGLATAWVGAMLLAVEPNLAAFIPNAGLDVIATEGIFFAALLAWRYFGRPSIGRLIAMCVATAAAMLLKHTAVVVPILIVLYGIAWLFVKRPAWRPALAHVAIGILVFLLAMWALLLFDISKPKGPRDLAVLNDFERSLTERRLPGGSYIGSIIMARAHISRGHPAFLLGKKSLKGGWWYYFPVVAFYKVPTGIAVMFIAAAVSVFYHRPRWDEWMLLLGMVGTCALLMQSGISIGFRHFLPAYLFILLLAARCAVAWKWLAWVGVASSFVHATMRHPNYISYTNYPHGHIWLKISDSNLEWGQSLKQIGQWIESHPEYHNRTIYLAHYLAERGPHAAYHVGPRATILTSNMPLPTSGLLIISPTWLVSAYQPGDLYENLRLREPIDIIAGSMLVYDLDQPLPAGATQPATKKTKRRPKPAD